MYPRGARPLYKHGKFSVTQTPGEPDMRQILIIVGIALLAAGIWVVAGNGSYQDTETVVKIGSTALKATHDKAIPQWLGIVGIVVGAVLALGGFAGWFKRK